MSYLRRAGVEVVVATGDWDALKMSAVKPLSRHAASKWHAVLTVLVAALPAVLVIGAAEAPWVS